MKGSQMAGTVSREKPPKTPKRRPSKGDAERRKRADAMRERLTAAMAKPECELDHKDAWTLLIATILSAQSTDKLVNTVTPKLFARFPTPNDLAAASQEEVEGLVHSTGFFRAKAKNIRETARLVAERFGGVVPRTVEELMTLPGVARKTSNVVLGTAYGIASGLTIDTHAGRLARRLELTEHDDPVKVERDLMGLFPQETWIDMSHRFVLHGRYTCLARKPACERCPLSEICPSRESPPSGTWQERAEREARVVASKGTDVT